MSSILEDLELLKMLSNEGLLEEYLFKVGLEIGMGPLVEDSNTGGLGVCVGLVAEGLGKDWWGPEGDEAGTGCENFLLGRGDCR